MNNLNWYTWAFGRWGRYADNETFQSADGVERSGESNIRSNGEEEWRPRRFLGDRQAGVGRETAEILMDRPRVEGRNVEISESGIGDKLFGGVARHEEWRRLAADGAESRYRGQGSSNRVTTSIVSGRREVDEYEDANEAEPMNPNEMAQVLGHRRNAVVNGMASAEGIRGIADGRDVGDAMGKRVQERWTEVWKGSKRKRI